MMTGAWVDSGPKPTDTTSFAFFAAPVRPLRVCSRGRRRLRPRERPSVARCRLGPSRSGGPKREALSRRASAAHGLGLWGGQSMAWAWKAGRGAPYRARSLPPNSFGAEFETARGVHPSRGARGHGQRRAGEARLPRSRYHPAPATMDACGRLWPRSMGAAGQNVRALLTAPSPFDRSAPPSERVRAKRPKRACSSLTHHFPHPAPTYTTGGALRSPGTPEGPPEQCPRSTSNREAPARLQFNQSRAPAPE